MEAFEKIFYELKPYLCIALSLFALKVADVSSMPGKLSAFVLLIVGAFLLYSRYRGRGIIK